MYYKNSIFHPIKGVLFNFYFQLPWQPCMRICDTMCYDVYMILAFGKLIEVSWNAYYCMCIMSFNHCFDFVSRMWKLSLFDDVRILTILCDLLFWWFSHPFGDRICILPIGIRFKVHTAVYPCGCDRTCTLYFSFYMYYAGHGTPAGFYRFSGYTFGPAECSRRIIRMLSKIILWHNAI